MNDLMTTNGIQAQADSAGDLTVVAREQTEIQSSMVLAKKFPRNEQACFTRAVKAFERPSMAEAAQYSFKRGGNTVKGPTVDTARELARCWGNIRYGLRIVDQSDKQVHIRGFATDLETNAYVEAEDAFNKLIQRKFDSPQGKISKWVEPDERDLRELINRRGAILVRNCILQVLPPDIVDDVLSVADTTLGKIASKQLTDNREDTIKRLTVAFDRVGVTVEMLEQYLGHKLAQLVPDQIKELNQIHKSIKDGQAKREEFFTFDQPVDGKTVTDSMKDTLRNRRAKSEVKEPTE